MFHEIFKQLGTTTVFDETSGVFPAWLEIRGHREYFHTDITMKLTDGRICHPAFDGTPVYERYRLEHSECLELQNVIWKDASGQQTDIFRLGLRYEFDDSGATFVSGFFHGENLNPPAIESFVLNHQLDFSAFNDVRWEYFKRPECTNPTLIMLNYPEREIPAGASRQFENLLISKTGFNCRGRQGDSVYMEFFVEGGGSLDAGKENVRSGVIWDGLQKAAVTWNFMTHSTKLTNRVWQWRNRWGWIVRDVTAQRHFPPLRMYHFFDNEHHYPTEDQVRKAARTGADVLVMHEIWRMDVQNGSFPYDPVRLRKIISLAHELGLRIALYVRGSETSIAQYYASWFSHLLKRDWDGLYMDYGSAMLEAAPASEWFPCGAFLFRHYLERLYHLREAVGENGLLLSHTGPIFSALGMAPGLLDMYVSGECEAGKMVAGRAEHDYYAETFCGAGSMWTAAFPEYGTGKMVPFLAVAGQSPHVPFGVQFRSSSLAHCPEPGMESHHLRPLWKIWGLFAGKRNIRFYNHLNSTLQNSSLAIDDSDGSALLLLANFSNTPQHLAEKADWDSLGLKVKRIRRFQPTMETPVPPAETTELSADLEPYGIAGFLINGENLTGEIRKYLESYPEMDQADRAYLDEVENQRKLRERGCSFAHKYMRVSIPPMPLPFEDSLNNDLYDNVLEYGHLDSDGKFIHDAWIATEGLVEQRPTHDNFIFCGGISAWMDITGFKAARQVIRTIHGNIPFYSFIEVEFSDEPAVTPKTYVLRFVNELEPDRSMLNWNCPEM